MPMLWLSSLRLKFQLVLGGLRQLGSHWLNNSCFHTFSLVMGAVRSSTTSTPLGAYSPAAITALETIQTQCVRAHVTQSLSRQVPIHPWVESAHTGEVTCPRTQRHTAASETSRAKVAGRSHRVTTPCRYIKHRSLNRYTGVPCIKPQCTALQYNDSRACDMEYAFQLYRDTESALVVTARELVVISGYFYVPLNIAETAPPQTWPCEPR